MVPEDLFALSEDCLMHRMRLNYEALADGLTVKSVLEQLLSDLGAPKMAARTTPAMSAGVTTATNAS